MNESGSRDSSEMATADRGTTPDTDDVRAAAVRISKYSIVTPLLESWTLNKLVGGRILIKAEVLQRTGSFKFRGALNRLAQLTEKERRQGVVAYSTGNHAQAVALAARLFETTAVIVMPADAPKVKIEKTRAYGGEVITYDRFTGDRIHIGNQLVKERGLTLVPPYDDRDVIAGQGTLGLEIVHQAAQADLRLDALLICCSGGGLAAGCALALEAASPYTLIYSAEPEGFDDTARSLVAGKRVSNAPGHTSICDAILVDKPGEITFPINRRRLAGGLVVNDAEALDAVAFAYDELKLVVEPGGAVALAAVLSRKFDCRGKVVAVICSGGNVDAAVFRRALERAEGKFST